MDNVVFFSALVGAAAVGVLIALAWRRRGQSNPAVDADTVIEKVVTTASRAFEAHLRTGQAQLVHQREVIDQKWDGVTSKVSEELSGLRRLVTEIQKDRAVQHEGLTESLRNAAHQQQMLLASTSRLNDILANTQARGQWGERMAEDILRAAGLVEGVNYLKQNTTEAGTRPDFSFHLPDGRLLNMDVKFPLDGYVRFLEAASELERKAALKSFGGAVRRHVKDVACREAYKESITTVGYVLLFVPNDGVYAFIHEHYRSVFDEALEARVVICSPYTLFAMLALVRQAMETVALERSSQEILDHLTRFSDGWRRYVEQHDLVGRHLQRLSGAFEELSSTRRDQLERSLEAIEQLKSG